MRDNFIELHDRDNDPDAKVAWSKVAEAGSTFSNQKRAISAYEVLGYYKLKEEVKKGIAKIATANQWIPQDPQFTLVKVRILTGLRHQIRVHMQHLLEEVHVDKREERPDCLVSDFLYKKIRAVEQFDRQHLCERVFLHEQRMGMFDIEANDSVLFVKSDLPPDLQACMDKLLPDKANDKELQEHKMNLCKTSWVDRFCVQHHLDAAIRTTLSGGYWAAHPELREAFFEAFDAKTRDPALADKGTLRGLHVDGDHTLLVTDILEDIDEQLKVSYSWTGSTKEDVSWAIQPEGVLSQVLTKHIDERILMQKRARLAESKAQEEEPMPEGWRRLSDTVYLHEKGFQVERRPLGDDGVPEGWIKLATSQPDVFLYRHLATKRTQDARPSKGEQPVPHGWQKIEAHKEGAKKVYYMHTITKKVQYGMPCPGIPEDLPEGWEKVASSKSGGQPYYWHRPTLRTQMTRPHEDDSGLPAGWTTKLSSTGSKYYWHEASHVSQFERPGKEMSSEQ